MAMVNHRPESTAAKNSACLGFHFSRRIFPSGSRIHLSGFANSRLSSSDRRSSTFGEILGDRALTILDDSALTITYVRVSPSVQCQCRILKFFVRPTSQRATKVCRDLRLVQAHDVDEHLQGRALGLVVR